MDTIVVQLSTAADDQQRHFQFVTDCINCSPEYNVFQAFMPESAHYNQVRLEFIGVGHDGVFGTPSMPYYHFDGHLLLF